MRAAPISVAISRIATPKRPIGPGPSQALGWLGLYFLLAALPLGAVLLRPLPPGRGFWIEFAVGLGFVALAMFGLQFVLTARFRYIAAPYGLDTLLHFHRQAGLVASALALAHPLILFVAHPAYLEFLDPRGSFLALTRAAALWTLLVALVLLIVLTLWRQPIGLAYDWWRATHGILALLIVFIGLVHVLRVGYYVAVPWMQALWVAMTGGAMLLLVHARVVKPLQLRRTPYRVAEVRPERGESWTLVVEPVGHAGMEFEAGQFAWVTLGSSPFALEQHPFSMASSAADPQRIEFTIKELGDFTAGIGAVEPETTAFLEGPYGAFTLDPHTAGAVFIVGGVGITPVMSILRTLRDASDRRPLLLIYGNADWEEVIFREQLEELEQQLDLRLVHVIEEPPPGWTGASGRVSDALLSRHLPEESEGWEYFVCGPEPMMDLVEPFLLERGVPLRRLNSERFNIA